MCLKRAGIYTVEDLLNKSEEDLIRVRNLGKKSLEEVIQRLHSLGLELRDSCPYCNITLSDDDLNVGDKLCDNCRKRITRTSKAIDITIDVLPPETSYYTAGYSGLHIYINIKNNTSDPIKLRLKECAILKDGRQHTSECNLTGYSFSEDYVFPHTIKTFAKIWKTDSWNYKDLCYNDCLTLSFEDVDSGKIYFFKYTKTYDGWYFYDYYEIE